MKVRKVNPQRIASIIITVICLIMISIGISLTIINNILLNKYGVKSFAIVTKIVNAKRGTDIYYEYFIDSEKYNYIKVEYGNNNLNIGDTLYLLYYKKDPDIHEVFFDKNYNK